MPPTPIPARKATVGVVYLTPKGREVRVDRIGSTDVTVFRLANNDTIQIDSEYLLTPKEAPAAAPAAPVIPPHVDAVAGRGREVIQPWIRGEVPPVPTDADFDALMSADSRSWVRFEVGLERERRELAAKAAAEVPAASRVASALGGVVEAVEPIPDAVAVTAPIVVVAQGPVDVEEIPLTPEPDPVATGPADDLPWDAPEASDRPLVLPGASPAVAVVEATPEPVAAPVVVDVAPTVVEPTQAPIVEPAPVVATPEPTATKPVKERPRGYCPGCDQLLTVRADGGMMQHFTPDGRKGPDGKRVDCQGVGLAPRTEPAPIERLTLPEAMGVTVAPALVSPSSEPTIVEAVAAASAVLASQPVPVDVEAPGDARPADVVEPVRYTIGGSDEAGWCIVDLRIGRAMGRMQLDGSTYAELYATEAEAREALVYVREHGELPDAEAGMLGGDVPDWFADPMGPQDADASAPPLPARAAWHVVALDGLSPGGAARAAAIQTDLRRLADLVPAIVEAEEVRARLAAAGVSLTGF